MRKGGGKSKGSAFERDVAKKIVQAFRKQGIKQRECWRSVLSGGHKISCGDLNMSPRLERLFPYNVECKFYKKIEFWHFLVPQHHQQKSWVEVQWLRQMEQGQTKRPDLEPLLVMKQNHGPILAMYQSMRSGWRIMLFNDFLKIK